MPLRAFCHPIAPSDYRNLRISPPLTRPVDPPEPGEAEPNVREADKNTIVDLGRLAWLGTVLLCLVVVLILVLEGYYGYAAVTFAVAVAAAINLF